jgi:hypothetical protein
MKYVYLVSKHWSSDEFREQYETWEILPRPKNPGLFFTEDDLYRERDIKGNRLKDVIAKLSFLHPGLKYKKKFETFGDPEWVITFYTDDEVIKK